VRRGGKVVFLDGFYKCVYWKVCWKIAKRLFVVLSTLKGGGIYASVSRRHGDLAVGVRYMARIIEVNAEDQDMEVTACT
jgi:hypothetical protein